MSIEDRLRDALRSRASSVTARADLADVAERAASRERRTRNLLAAALVLALVAGPLAGFAIGRASDDGGSTRALVGTPSGRSRATPSTTPAPGSPVPSTWDTIILSTIDGGQPLQKLFRRTTDDSIAIRAYRSPDVPACGGTRIVTAGLSTDAAVGQAVGLPTGEGNAVLGSGTFGVGEGAPAWWAIVRVADGVAEVRAEGAAGADRMKPTEGIAVLAHTGDAGAIAVRAVDGAGHEVWSTTIPAATPGSVSSRSFSSSCGSGTASSQSQSSVVIGGSSAALPPPGEQPADAATARVDIEQAFHDTYNGGSPVGTRKAAIEGLDDVFDSLYAQALHGPFADGVKTVVVNVDDVVFTSPTAATVRYDLTDSTTRFPGQLGKAVLVDGHWKVARETYCHDLTLAAVTCPPK